MSTNKKIKSLKLNAVLNVIKSLMGIVFPLITFPYVTRILHVEYLGRVNYAQSLVSYFSLIAGLGISTYAMREGAKVRNKRESFQRFCNEIFTINLLTTAVAYGLLFILLFCVQQLAQYRQLIILISLSIIFTTIGIDWVNSIYEDYVVIAARSVIIQIVNLCLLFAFVKSENDYYIYAFLTVFPQMAICVCNFFYCRKYCNIRVIKQSNIKKHIKPMLTLFANNIAVTLYCNADLTMIGWMLSDYYVGIYSVAVKVYTIIRSLLASIFIVCIPRLSSFVGTSQKDKFRNLVNDITCVLIILALPAVTGLWLLAEPIVRVLAGADYTNSIMTLKILSLAIPFSVFGGVITNCINVPMTKESINLKATVIAAVTNIGLNIIMIPVFQQNGAALTTVLAEFTVIVVCFIGDVRLKKIFAWTSVLTTLFQSLAGCVGVGLVCFVLQQFIESTLYCCFASIMGSIVIYSIILILERNKYMVLAIGKAMQALRSNKKT